MQHEPHPESRDTLNAVEAVIGGGRRKQNFFEANILLLKEDSKKERTRKILFDLLVLIMIASAMVLLWVGVIDPGIAKRKEAEFGEMGSRTTQAPGQNSETPSGEDEDPEPETAPAISFDELLDRNADCVGFLNAPGAKINLPIVQTANNDYYLKRDFDLRPSQYGNPFLDYRVKLSPLSTNLVIYGHHMKDGSIFSKLVNYRKVETVREHPIITFQQPDGTTLQFKIFSVLDINGEPRHDNGYVFAVNTTEFPDQNSFDGYIRQLKQRSYIETPVDVEYGDKLISLQTCVYDFRPEYLYVVGRLIRPGESASVDSSQITANKNPRLPQALYDKYKQSNPFKNAEKWEAP